MRRDSNNRGLTYAAVSVVVLGLTSCTQLPAHVSIANKTSVEGTTAYFEQCARSVRFTGQPRPSSSHEAALLGAHLTKFAKWEVDGLVY